MPDPYGGWPGVRPTAALHWTDGQPYASWDVCPWWITVWAMALSERDYRDLEIEAAAAMDDGCLWGDLHE